MKSEKEQEQGRRFSEMLRQSYEASRYRGGIEWLQRSTDEEKWRESIREQERTA